MSRTDPPDDRFAARLEALHEALAHGPSSNDPPEASPHGQPPTEEDDDLRRAQHCLRLIERVRRHADAPLSGDTPPLSPDWLAGQLETPHRIGRFGILRRLGQGGSGVVFLAHDPQ
jgi:hypothetical protein